MTGAAAVKVVKPATGWFGGNGSSCQDAINQLALFDVVGTLNHQYNDMWGDNPYASIGTDWNPVNGQGAPMAGGQRLLLSVPLCGSTSTSTLADTIVAANLSEYGVIAEKLAAANCSNAIIRLGWECNGGWYPWSNQGSIAYVEAYQAVVETMRKAVKGNKFLFEFNVNGGWGPLTSQQPNPGTPFQDAKPGETYEETYLRWYPGKRHVDVIGQDTYVGPYSIGLTNTPPQTAWIAATYDALVKMAVQLGQRWSTSEYGSLFGDNPEASEAATEEESKRLVRHGWFDAHYDESDATIDGDAVTAEFLGAVATVLKGERPESAWDVEIGGWTAKEAPPAAFYHSVYNWTGDATYMTVGNPPSLNSLYAQSDAAYKAAWAA